ncbi:monosaccharide ABC transporter ATP-binding protein (CUT2 family) [Plasticicumulans lactativorans]|uniref:Ribose/galactose/methyl galactoside import ATP-binding protein n=2 Tax=Plasticicumulans lactativorans TaxID=1133106 RepID=A0A4R2LJV1_9GAMM|nr:monosaccharide ABC transporter ATP-binding protein (CUT2 family) [Plasticicumulans lactativorans]
MSAVLKDQTSSTMPRAAAGTYLLEAEGIMKGFPGVIALAGVQLKLRPGTVHALMGENGAGKSTLMKIIAGIYQPDEGQIRVKGERVVLHSPLDALQKGIAMIHQELNLVPFTTIAENIWIGREPLNKLGFVDHAELFRRTRELFDRLHIDLDPEEQVQHLSIANRQMVEIAKAVSYDSDVLIMDEPTSAITEKEVEHLFAIIADLKAQGKGIVYITHKMVEVFNIADDISVFRDGHYITTKPASELDRDKLITLMVGRELTQMFPKTTVPLRDVVLDVRSLSRQGVFSGVSFQLRGGEILGFAGLMGAGRTEVAETIYGMYPASGGEIYVNGKRVEIKSPRQAIDAGLALLTEDRKASGLFLVLPVLENMEIASLPGFLGRLGFVRQRTVSEECEKLRQSLRVKTPSLYQIIENLSGGNQQKALIGRWLLTKPKVLILDEPTRGIDVGAKAEIYKLISELAADGVAIIMISSEMAEIIGMCDRVLVMHDGHVTGELKRDELTQEAILHLASD